MGGARLADVFDALVTTPKAFEVAQTRVDNVALRWTSFKLVAFDEVHHVLKDHPYKKLAASLRRSGATPRELGGSWAVELWHLHSGAHHRRSRNGGSYICRAQPSGQQFQAPVPRCVSGAKLRTLCEAESAHGTTRALLRSPRLLSVVRVMGAAAAAATTYLQCLVFQQLRLPRAWIAALMIREPELQLLVQRQLQPKHSGTLLCIPDFILN